MHVRDLSVKTQMCPRLIPSSTLKSNVLSNLAPWWCQINDILNSHPCWHLDIWPYAMLLRCSIYSIQLLWYATMYYPFFYFWISEWPRYTIKIGKIGVKRDQWISCAYPLIRIGGIILVCSRCKCQFTRAIRTLKCGKMLTLNFNKLWDKCLCNRIVFLILQWSEWHNWAICKRLTAAHIFITYMKHILDRISWNYSILDFPFISLHLN